jgi:pectate lyase
MEVTHEDTNVRATKMMMCMWLGAGIGFSAMPATAPARTAAVFPAAEGFGAEVAGGRGGRVLAVTTLSDRGAGSLRHALSARGPRIIRFDVEGTIELESPLVVTEGQVTIDGETAPGQGITLLHHGIHFRGNCKDIIVRHLRIRVTTGGSSGDALLFWGTDGGTVERVLVEHCSLMGATDENVNTWGSVRDVTFQWTIIAEGRLPHSMGWLSGVGSDRITIHHCLFAHNADRSPRLAGGLYDVVNNVIYNWSHHNAAKIGQGARVNFVNNAFIPGPQSTATQACILPEDPDKGTKVYLAGNIGPFTPTGAEDQWLNVTYYQRVEGKWIQHRPAPEDFRANDRFPVEPVTTQSAKQAYDLVLTRAGARVRDADDLRVIEEVRTRTGRIGREE